MKIISSKSVAPIYLKAGYTLQVNYTGVDGVTTLFTTDSIDEDQVIDKFIFTRIEDEFGLSSGIGILMGKSV